MRIGVIGPADDVEEGFREAVSFLLGDADVEQVVYLGTGDFVERAIESWASERAEETFLERAALLAQRGRPDEIELLLEADTSRSRLEFVRKLPPFPARAIEMMDDRMVLFVHDKAILNEEDIANAQLIVYGRASESDLRRFGQRTFFTPGPLCCGRVGVLEACEDGVTVSLYDLAGIPVWRELVASKTMKVMVAK